MDPQEEPFVYDPAGFDERMASMLEIPPMSDDNIEFLKRIDYDLVWKWNSGEATLVDYLQKTLPDAQAVFNKWKSTNLLGDRKSVALSYSNPRLSNERLKDPEVLENEIIALNEPFDFNTRLNSPRDAPLTVANFWAWLDVFLRTKYDDVGRRFLEDPKNLHDNLLVSGPEMDEPHLRLDAVFRERNEE